MRNNCKISRYLLVLALCLAFSSIARGQIADPASPKPPPGVYDLLFNQKYGGSSEQKFDVYLPEPEGGAGSPIIFMVHGGAWVDGDKRFKQVYLNKAQRWVPRGFVFVSVNYRLVTDSITPLDQASDVARALARVQKLAPLWNADPTKVILMGHSAGAHLISLVHSKPIASWGLNLVPWLGTVSLDGAALDVVKIMEAKPYYPPYYEVAFGDDRDFWEAASPFHALQGPTQPWLGVCSTRRPPPDREPYFPDSCKQAEDYEAQAEDFECPNANVQIETSIGHDAINETLGLDNDYTRRVEAFMKTLDSDVSSKLP